MNKGKTQKGCPTGSPGKDGKPETTKEALARRIKEKTQSNLHDILEEKVQSILLRNLSSVVRDSQSQDKELLSKSKDIS